MKWTRRCLTVLVLGAVAALAVPMGASAASQSKSEIVRVWHPPVTATSVTGSGLGTIRTYFTPTTINGVAGGLMTGTLTTTAINATAGFEWRTSNLVFVMDTPQSQLVVGGALTYPTGASTFSAGTTDVRPIIGGSGRYDGATGYVTSTNNGANGWLHVFHVRR